MQRFARLYVELDRTTATSEKIAAMASYFSQAPAADAAWAAYILTGQKLKRLMRTSELAELAIQLTNYPGWLLEECYAHVGDMAETLTLLIQASEVDVESLPLHVWIEQRLLVLPKLDIQTRYARVSQWWLSLPTQERFVLNKLLTGALRVGVSQRLVAQALAQCSGLPSATIAHRLMGAWQPTPERFLSLLSAQIDAPDVSQPYPFFLASPLENPEATLGSGDEWLAEWKWDGIRAQLIKRAGQIAIWSRGEERMDGRFPEIETAATLLPVDCVLDGELLAWQDPKPLPFTVLQKRIGRLKPSAKLQVDVPLIYMAFDLLEINGIDLREMPLTERRLKLSQLLDCADPHLRLSPSLDADGWQILARLREQSREFGTEGLLLKRRNSIYQVGRKRGDWWKWKIDPYTLDAVLIYAQPGHGRRSNLYTDYTFGVWDKNSLIPVAKAYSGLTDAEILALDRWIRANTVERFGPVRSLTPHHVFELAFEAINVSKRHKSGVAVRFPRILRWRTDLSIKDADSLDQLKQLAHPVT